VTESSGYRHTGSLSISPARRGFAAGPQAESSDSAFIIVKAVVTRRDLPSESTAECDIIMMVK
jgi:hypothetical protein